MENSMTTNGEVETIEKFHDSDEAKISKLVNKIEGLESEKIKLTNENKEMMEQMEKLNHEMDHLQKRDEEMRLEMDEWDEDSSFLESIAARSANLETEVTRLQHDLRTSTREVGEAKKEVIQLKKALEEKALVIERLRHEIAELRKEKVKREKKGRELEAKIGILEVRVTEERGKKSRVQEEMKERIDELKKKIEDLEADAAKMSNELKRRKEEKRQCEEKAMGLEFNMLALKDMVDEKTNEAKSGKVKDIGYIDKRLEVPIATVGTVAAIAVVVAVWDKVETKTTVLLYGGGAIVVVWLSSILVGAINSVPLVSESSILVGAINSVPLIMELVGLGYSRWFFYRDILFKIKGKSSFGQALLIRGLRDVGYEEERPCYHRDRRKESKV
ncbi:peroxisomal and mitochondrial division factor 2-like [Gossypium arboreum]|uniref:peroxisomal and mitochondrial division factor 2-like n=1 Tax=Gossypium arboreum TaxID=29729 RepID=UPI0008193F1A|nr:peroxisomal and mitochondrial division factor 2-like [Gossypium arboreum]